MKINIFLKSLGSFRNRLNFLGTKISEENLIVFDYKTIMLVIISLFLFSGMVLFKIHGSSVPIWNDYLSDGKEEGLIVGTPRSIRSDEWLVQTPFILSQLNQKDKFSLENESLGEGRVPLLMNLPTKHVTSFFRPQNWGFFQLDSERGLSFYWNFRIFAFFIGFFFLLMIITKSNFWISFLFSVWLFFSNFIQWWFLPDMVTAFSFIFIAASYIFISKKKLSIGIASLLLSIFAVNFVLVFYPPFQVPLAYLLLFLIGGFLLKNFSIEKFKTNMHWRIMGVTVATVVSASVLFIFYVDMKETLQLILNTVYPGKRTTTGGEITYAHFFSGFYGIFMRENIFPFSLGNISEASNFVLLFPLSILAAASNFVSRKKNDLLLISVLVYLVLISFWVLVGFPEGISKFTFMSFVSSKRALLGVGVASIISLAIVLSKGQEIIKNKRTLFLVLAIIFFTIMAHGLTLRKIDPSFFRYLFILFVSGFFTVLSYLFFRGKNVAFAALIAFFAFVSTFFVNPISRGLGPIYSKEVSRVIASDAKKDPNAYWAFFGFHIYADFAKASGARVFNGVQYTPKLGNYKILDQDGMYEDVYNRYAHVAFTDNGMEEPSFVSPQPDVVEVRVNPCSDKLNQMGINRFAFDYKPDEKKLSCLKPLFDDNLLSGVLWVYERK